jgi:hypothetical protein
MHSQCNTCHAELLDVLRTSSGSIAPSLASRPVMLRTKRRKAGMRVAPPTNNTCVMGARLRGRTCMAQTVTLKPSGVRPSGCSLRRHSNSCHLP